MWEKIVLNLVSNAFKYTLEGRIEVSLRQEGDRSELEVKDTGVGIPAEEMPKLFERFHRVEASRGRTQEGSGIGLALVKELARFHGGDVRAESRPGQGSTFTVSIPLGSSHLPADRVGARREGPSTALGAASFVEEAQRWLPGAWAAAPPAIVPSGDRPPGASSPPPGSRPRVLLADDNADMREYVRRLLATRFAVEAVGDGVSALASARSLRPDLVLSDVMMPGLDGFGLLRELRADPGTRDVPVLLLSARAGEEVEGLEAGADDYLTKPFHARELLARVASQIDLAALRRQAETERRLGEERSRAILESITDAFFAVDRAWKFTYVNRQAEQVLDRRAGELLGRTLWEVFPGLVGSEFEPSYLRAMDQGESSSLTSYYLDHDRWYEVHTYPAAEGVSIYFRDVTEKVRAEERERALLSEAASANLRFRAFFEQGALFAGIMAVDGTILEPNRLSLEACGFTREQVIGRKFWECPWWSPSPDVSRTIREASALAALGHTFRAEMPYFVADGGQGVLDLILLPIKDDEGRVLFLAPTGTDVTERKRAEAALIRLTLESEQQRRVYETALSNTADFNYVFDLDGRFSYVNDALLSLWRKTLPEAIGKNFFELDYPQELAQQLQDEIRQVIRTKSRVRGETPYTGPDGERQYEYIFVPVLKDDGSVGAVAGSTRDITERKEWEEGLRRLAADLSEADRRKDEFLATLAHELRNPLAPIRNGLQILRLAGDDRSAAEEARMLMERQVAHMVRLIDDLLDVSRITRGKLELRRERVELAAVVQVAVETSRPLVESAGHELSVTMPARPIVLDADPTRLAQVISNLLNNAAKYTEPGGQIALVVERRGGEAVVTIRDNGVGIPAEMLPRVFDMFAQVDQSLEKSQGGLGIGLTLVQRLTQMHGGSVEARSDGRPGLGSEFQVRLPIEAEATARPAARPASPLPLGPSPSLRILIVDDNLDSARTLARLLRLLGHRTFTAHDGGEALEVAEEERPDVVLLDIGLPVLNGYDVARQIRQRPWGRDIQIIALTGWGQESDRQRSKESGFDHHLVKPIDPDALRGLLLGPTTNGGPAPSPSATVTTAPPHGS